MPCFGQSSRGKTISIRSTDAVLSEFCTEHFLRDHAKQKKSAACILSGLVRHAAVLITPRNCHGTPDELLLFLRELMVSNDLIAVVGSWCDQ
eukprot:scaffold898_cov168-Amphora_coffeaeformis.AAC.7